LTVALKIQEARATLTKVTPIKGDTFENQVNVVLAEIAAGLGDEYTDTRNSTGAVHRCKKGDGVLSINDDTTRVVIEMTDSAVRGGPSICARLSVTAKPRRRSAWCGPPTRMPGGRSAYSGPGAS
jgi:hypothetical protein